jgi:hypothetical protein
MSGGDQETVASVAGHKISQIELDNALRERVERARRQMRGSMRSCSRRPRCGAWRSTR